ncbi:MAG TPA: Gfo/Idh/MocA family oxidoreductase, partial [Candidatus Limnocylindrales bacterium]
DGRRRGGDDPPRRRTSSHPGMTGRDDARAAAPRTPPLGLGLIGLGNVGIGFHLPALLALPELVTIAAVADPSPDRRAEALARAGLPPAAGCVSAEELLERDDLDAVDLATPPHVRTPLALRAIERGLAVLCEKPVATVPADAAAVVDAAARAGIPVGVVHNYLEFPEIRVAIEAIRSGAIGRPEVAILNYLGVEDRPGNAAWRPNWRHDPGVAGGGVLMDMLHVVYVAEALLDAPVRRVSAQLLARTAPAPVEEIALCRFDAEAATALVNVGWGVGPGGISVSGRDGRIDIAYEGGGTSPFAPLASVRLVPADGTAVELTPPLPATPGLDVRLVATFRRFFEAVVEGRPPAVTAADGLRVLELTLAAYASAAIGCGVDVPLGSDHPVHRRGLAGIADLSIAPAGAVARHGLFGIGVGGGG